MSFSIIPLNPSHITKLWSFCPPQPTEPQRLLLLQLHSFLHCSHPPTGSLFWTQLWVATFTVRALNSEFVSPTSFRLQRDSSSGGTQGPHGQDRPQPNVPSSLPQKSLPSPDSTHHQVVISWELCSLQSQSRCSGTRCHLMHREQSVFLSHLLPPDLAPGAVFIIWVSSLFPQVAVS